MTEIQVVRWSITFRSLSNKALSAPRHDSTNCRSRLVEAQLQTPLQQRRRLAGEAPRAAAKQHVVTNGLTNVSGPNL
jgi:hypothetical protein